MDLLMLIGMLWSLVREGDIMEVAIVDHGGIPKKR